MNKCINIKCISDTVLINTSEWEATKKDSERYRWLVNNGQANSKTLIRMNLNH